MTDSRKTIFQIEDIATEIDDDDLLLKGNQDTQTLQAMPFSVVNVASQVTNSPETTTPVDANLFGIVVSGVLNFLSFENLRATLATTLEFLQSGTGAVSRSLESKNRDIVSVKDFNTVGDGVADDTTGITAADAIVGTKYVPAGIYDTTLAATALDGPYFGDGQIRDVSNNLRGKWFSAIKAAPSSQGTHTSLETAFNGDISKVQIAMEHRITGVATLTQPSSGYKYLPEAYPHYTYLYNSSGHNEETDGNDGRTAACAYHTRIFQSGQGDMVAYNAIGFVGSTKAGATSWLASPAAVLFNGQVTAGAAGVYLNPGEILCDDNGNDCAAIGWVVKLDRSVATAALGEYWAGYRVQSQGTEEADVAFSAVGPFNFGLDLSFLTLNDSQAAITLKADQRIYGNVTATDPTGVSRFPSDVSTTYFTYASGGFWNFVVSNSSKFQISSSQVSVTSNFRHTGTSLGFYNSAVVAKQEVTGSHGSNAALQSLLSALSTIGLITNSSTA